MWPRWLMRLPRPVRFALQALWIAVILAVFILFQTSGFFEGGGH
jgi:uncharacterized membrane protein